jgi:hypothetical protein
MTLTMILVTARLVAFGSLELFPGAGGDRPPWTAPR